ncbi:hypothetical protein [Enterococcus casseliflavus]
MVTKNIPNYAVVAGNLAKIIKYRFSEEIQLELLKSKRVNHTPEDLVQFNDSFNDANLFVSNISHLKEFETKI